MSKHSTLVAAAATMAVLVVATPSPAQCNGVPLADSQCDPYVFPGAPGVYEVVMDVSAATPDLIPACGFNVGHTVWFKYTAIADGLISFTSCTEDTSYDTVIQGWLGGGDCEFPQRIDTWCEDDSPECGCANECSAFRASTITIAATTGTTYLFQVGSYDNNSELCDLCLGVTLVVGAAPPENDDCCAATPITEGSYPFDITTASSDGPVSCDDTGPSFVNDIWYLYTASCSGEARASLCAADFEARLAVYADDACPGSLLACNFNTCGFRQEVTFAASAGTSYLIRVGGFIDTGTGGLDITCDAPTCPEDLNGNGQVDFADILRVIAAWGPCP
ncbi:MAG: hypothetical protein GY715_20075 [Planctomycetes bacterium]|nr:hypothetical protein [Planctomycetota bacterium]